MARINPQHVKRMCEVINASPYPTHMSMKIVALEPGEAKFEIEVQDKHFQPFRVVHGGVLATILDSATFWAVYLNIEDPAAGLTSVDLKLNYLEPVMGGKLLAHGWELRAGKRLCYAVAEVRSKEGKLLAHGTSTLMVLPGKAPRSDPNGTTLPPKFLSS